MKNTISLTVALLCLQLSSNAQKEPISVTATAGMYVAYSDDGLTGPGFELKASKKISPSSSISIGLGYITLCSLKNPYHGYVFNTRQVPVLIGYKKCWNKFYLEPRAGIGEFGGKFSLEGGYSKPSVLAFMYTLGAGYSFRKIELGMEVQGGAIGISSPKAGFWYNKRQYYSAVKISIPLFEIK